MKIKCYIDFKMEDSGEISFKAGKSYEFTIEDSYVLCLIDEQGEKHYMDMDDINEMQNKS